jgi:hypothetical protein
MPPPREGALCSTIEPCGHEGSQGRGRARRGEKGKGTKTEKNEPRGETRGHSVTHESSAFTRTGIDMLAGQKSE